MKKSTAIKLLGGTPMKAAKACRYKAVQTVYVWPDELSLAQELRVRNAVERLQRNVQAKDKRVKKRLTAAITGQATGRRSAARA